VTLLHIARRGLARILAARREGRLHRALRWRWHKLETALWRRLGLAALYRRLLACRVTFVGVTGSCGKTTATQLVAAVLGARLSGRATSGNHKVSPHLERALFRLRPWHRFFVVELAIANGKRRVLDDTLRLIRPEIGVVTVIGTDHLSLFQSAEGAAAQKGRLIEGLPAHGTAVLNADDPLVRAMAQRTRARVLTFGLAEGADLRAESVEARWPERLSFTLVCAGRRTEVRTQLCGAQLLPSLLGALAVGHALGIPLEEAARAVAAVPPFDRRMSPAAHAAGFTVIRDDWKAPLWSIPAALEFVREARAARKVVVLGTLSDFHGNSNGTYRAVAREALAVADRAVFVGNNSAKALAGRRHAGDEALQAFYSAEAAAEHLHAWLRPGDLVLLKGSPLDRLGAIAAERPLAGTVLPASRGCPVVVGLGNPGARFRDTPHNVGHRVLARLASELGARFEEERDGRVARAVHAGEPLLLVEPAARMNVTGPCLTALARRLGFAAGDLVLVLDDLDLPLGTVRVRERSGDGGHRGLRSVLEAFRTDEIRRVRIGVGRPARGREVEAFVVAPFDPESLARVDAACAEAAARVLELLGRSAFARTRRAG
jgi:aminoacyl-tRNA hydrolase